jgi:hypothetical protein
VFFSPTADRGRSRKKKRDFFGAMRTRFNRSKFRSKSIDASQHDQYRDSYGLSPGQARSISADGTRNSSEPSIGKRNNLYTAIVSNRNDNPQGEWFKPSGVYLQMVLDFNVLRYIIDKIINCEYK